MTGTDSDRDTDKDRERAERGPREVKKELRQN